MSMARAKETIVSLMVLLLEAPLFLKAGCKSDLFARRYFRKGFFFFFWFLLLKATRFNSVKVPRIKYDSRLTV